MPRHFLTGEELSAPELDALLDGLRLVVVANAMARGLLAPRYGNWRVLDINDRVAALLFRLWLAVATILAAERLLEPAADAAASLNIAVAGRAIGAPDPTLVRIKAEAGPPRVHGASSRSRMVPAAVAMTVPGPKISTAPAARSAG